MICWCFGKTIGFDVGIKLERSEWGQGVSARSTLGSRVWGAVIAILRNRKECEKFPLLTGIELTGYGSRLFGILASNEKHHVTLTGVDIVVFQKEDLVNTVFLESAKFDEKANRPS